jgi:hypothetical protein
MPTARGTFDVDLRPVHAEEVEFRFAHLHGSKTFHGDLEGTSVVEMLSEQSAVEGSAGYVALEQVAATLDGRKGTFVLQHFGLVNRGESELRVSVVPDSGTAGLRGLSGELGIDVVDGRHDYTFDYSLDPT